MRLTTDSITSQAARGRCCLQVPEYCIVLGTNAEPEPTQEYPDDWFVRLKHGRPVVAGERTGFLHLTRKGFEANKEALRHAFEEKVGDGTNYPQGKNTWEDFERLAEEDFANREKVLRKLKVNLEKKLASINNLLGD